jgi:hypothetical protein
MKKTIWKFELDIENYKKFEMPKNAEILTLQTQNKIPCLWALVDPSNDRETRTFEVYGTGHPIHHDMRTSRNYIGTFQLNRGRSVFHVFEYKRCIK